MSAPLACPACSSTAPGDLVVRGQMITYRVVLAAPPEGLTLGPVLNDPADTDATVECFGCFADWDSIDAFRADVAAKVVRT